jgi:hypothetical protein
VRNTFRFRTAVRNFPVVIRGDALASYFAAAPGSWPSLIVLTRSQREPRLRSDALCCCGHGGCRNRDNDCDASADKQRIAQHHSGTEPGLTVKVGIGKREKERHVDQCSYVRSDRQGADDLRRVAER